MMKRTVENPMEILISKTDTVLPVIDGHGSIHYPVLEELGITTDMLENAVRNGILERHVYDKILVCPIHNNILNRISLYCPECNSKNVKKMHLIEHISCGFIGEKEKFNSINGRLMCPSCNTPITEKNSTMLGVWYVCNQCSAKFNNPIPRFQCNDHTLDMSTVDI
ncbi:MAG: hypothetical protein NZ517_08650, partial [Candidatus Nitrosocaldus sp.]|nr:hypothetical protein [Candidatus Nitrosocaldus sp.]